MASFNKEDDRAFLHFKSKENNGMVTDNLYLFSTPHSLWSELGKQFALTACYGAVTHI